uniref:Retrotransposon gag domain-containing protein n=2 Tax=Nicotiana TaxID=4085 RepID=A0A1S3X637_TOBAC|nr:PREDICTED: uncharacterized protein LOC104221878 [Nicotiana sylvestris]XP_016435384.1 PREDICTED: uncharacterized protein LOC107761652 [Nicotiana tabacum]
MEDKFVTAHAWAKKEEARVNDIFAVRQTPGEGLRDFLARFNRMRMILPNVSEGMAVVAFQNGLSRNGSRATRKLVSKLMKYPPTTWEEIHNAYCAEVRADEDELNGPIQRLTLVQAEARKDRCNEGRRDQLGPRLGRERHQPYIRTTIPHPSWHMDGPPRHTTTPQNEREIVYALENLGTKVQWLQKMKSDPSTRKTNALCEFHQERGHKIDDYIGLQQEVVRMLNQGHLRERMSDRGRANFASGREKPPGTSKTAFSRSYHTNDCR